MSDEEDSVDAPKSAGIPAWVMTFADLMSLLMCFFVLLLSFSQMDLAKFKKVAGSMERAFGVQRDIVAYEIPKGTSIIAKEFSPGKPQPTMLNEVRQKTVEEMRSTLDFDEIRTSGDVQSRNEFEHSNSEDLKNKDDDKKGEGSGKEAAEIAEELINEIMDGVIEIESFEQRIVIRILEQGSFSSGEDVIRPSFIPVIHKIRKILEKLPGQIIISGHTDNVPIYTSRFRSNWDLSAARAVTVTHHLFDKGSLDKNRVTVSGFADTKPLFKNDTREHRAHNRRVEIELIQNAQDEKQEIKKVIKKSKLNKVKKSKLHKPKIHPVTGYSQTDNNTVVQEPGSEVKIKYSTDGLFKSNYMDE
tara:strand:- start:34003 stop:35079 length:1077 start_codon:yes stop_codon:yes gene_type:complete